MDIRNSSKYSVTLVKISDQVSVSTMSVIGVTSADYGTYICEVRNELGSTFAKAVLSGKRNARFIVTLFVASFYRKCVCV